MYEHKKKLWKLTDCLDEMYWLWFRLAYYDKDLKISVWDREIKKKRTIKTKEPQKHITTYYNEGQVKWLCSFYKDLEDLYFDWLKVRSDCGEFKPFSDISEKSAWKKLGSVPKAVAKQMLDNSWASSYWKIYYLPSYEVEKIIQPIREAQRVEEKKLEGFVSDDELKQAEAKKRAIEEYIIQHPNLKEESRSHVLEKQPNLRPDLQEKMIYTRIRMLANNNLKKDGKIL